MVHLLLMATLFSQAVIAQMVTVPDVATGLTEHNAAGMALTAVIPLLSSTA